jgi:5-methyltetrahydropteroyltriglutamate--homocysteine methyltransferase
MANKIESALIGGLPRPFKFSRVLVKFREGKLERHEFEEIYNEYLKRSFSRLRSVGINNTIHGLYLWDDLFSPFSSSMHGVKQGPLFRFFDNNFYYRIPVIENQIKLENPVTIDWYKNTVKIASEFGLNVHAMIPGPLTFGLMSENRYYTSVKNLIIDLASALSTEVYSLAKEGAKVIEVHEPYLIKVTDTPTLEVFKAALAMLRDNLDITLWVQTYFGSAFHLIQFKDFYDVLGLDFTSVKEFLTSLKKFDIKDLSLAIGLIDSRNTKMERVKILRSIIKDIIKMNPKNLFITPSSMMDFIPESVAFKKLRILSKSLVGVI